MAAICSSETSVDTQRTRHYIPEDGTLHILCLKHLNGYVIPRVANFTEENSRLYSQISGKAIVDPTVCSK
jgi:hypothetical protein